MASYGYGPSSSSSIPTMNHPSVAATGAAGGASRQAVVGTTTTNNNNSNVSSTNNNNSMAMNAGLGGSNKATATAAIVAGEELQQKQWLMEANRRIREQVYYMRKAMDDDYDLAVTLERASHVLAELGDPTSSSASAAAAMHSNRIVSSSSTTGIFVLSPKSYYELHMRTLEEMPTLQDFFHSITEDDDTPNSMMEIYQATQYCPKLVPRLYLQICAGSVLLQDILTKPNTASTKNNNSNMTVRRLLNDLADAVKCVQCPVRGLFLRHYLLQAIRDKLPDNTPSTTSLKNDATDADADAIVVMDATTTTTTETNNSDNKSDSEQEQDEEDVGGSVEDSYQFVLNNFIEMNKLWVRIQHMPVPSSSANNNNGGGMMNVSSSKSSWSTGGNTGGRPSKEARRKRERERNELRILVGTNLERLSKLEGVTIQIYQQHILPTILHQISVCRDALAQAYLMDCIIQVFPDDFHIPSLELFLSVCPKLREKVNVRTILNAIMERLANYYAEDIYNTTTDDTKEEDYERSLLLKDAFGMFHNCIQSVFQARGPNMPAKEIIRLQTALLNFSLRCFPNRMDHLSLCLQSTVQALTATTTNDNKDNNTTTTTTTTLSIQPTIEETTTTTTTTTESNNNVSTNWVLPVPSKPLDKVAEEELEKLLSIPLDTLALKVLELDSYSDLLAFLPWDNRKQVAVVMMKAVEASQTVLTELHPMTQLFRILLPLVQTEESAYLEQQQQQAGKVDTTTTKAGEDHHAQLLGSLVGGGGKSSMRSSRNNSSNSMKGFVLEPCDELSAMIREEQLLLAKMVHLIHHEDTDVHFEMLTLARNLFSKACLEKRPLIVPPLIISTLQLVQRVMLLEFQPQSQQQRQSSSLSLSTLEAIEEKDDPIDGNEEDTTTEDPDKKNQDTTPTPPYVFDKKITCRKIFVFLQKTVSMMLGSDSETAFKLYLQVALASNQCAKAHQEQQQSSSSGAATAAAAAAVRRRSINNNDNNEFATMTYELITQAFMVYEDEIFDSKTQQNAIVAMIATLLACRCLEKDDYEALITKTTQYAAKQLKKADQCKMVILCSHLFYTGGPDDPTAYRNPQRVLECLQRSLKIADTCTMASPANVQLFVDILDRYVFHYEMNNPVISSNFVSGLIALIEENMESMDEEVPAVSQANHQFQQIVQYISDKKNNPSTAERFASIEC